MKKSGRTFAYEHRSAITMIDNIKMLTPISTELMGVWMKATARSWKVIIKLHQVYKYGVYWFTMRTEGFSRTASLILHNILEWVWVDDPAKNGF